LPGDRVGAALRQEHAHPLPSSPRGNGILGPGSRAARSAGTTTESLGSFCHFGFVWPPALVRLGSFAVGCFALSPVLQRRACVIRTQAARESKPSYSPVKQRTLRRGLSMPRCLHSVVPEQAGIQSRLRRLRIAKSSATTSPPPLAGEGQGGGMQARTFVSAPLPTPPPQAGEGADRVRGAVLPSSSPPASCSAVDSAREKCWLRFRHFGFVLLVQFFALPHRGLTPSGSRALCGPSCDFPIALRKLSARA
jgi:hypothetical protein